MSNKNLLSESQIRQFMKLAHLTPLTPGFVEGLTENTDEELEESHGRGSDEYNASPSPHRGGGVKLDEADEESELHATEDELGDMDAEADRERDEIDDLEDADADGRMISVDDFLSALESALESAMGEEVEISDEMDDDPVEADVELDAEMDMDGDDVDVDMDVEDMLQEKAYSAKREKPGADKRKGAEKRGAEGTLAKTKGHGRVDYVNEEEGSKKGEYLRKDKDGKVGHRRGVVDGGKYGKGGHYKAKYEESVDELTEEEGSKKGEYLRKDKDGKVGKRRGDVGGGKYGKGGHYKAYEMDETLSEDEAYTSKREKPGADKRKGAMKRGAEATKLKHDEPGGRGHKKGDDAYVNESTDELVEQITKRVAARILKSALSKK